MGYVHLFDFILCYIKSNKMHFRQNNIFIKSKVQKVSHKYTYIVEKCQIVKGF